MCMLDMVVWCVPMYVVGVIFSLCVCVRWRGGGEGRSEWVGVQCM